MQLVNPKLKTNCVAKCAAASAHYECKAGMGL